jgi:hypothetical protein
MKPIKAVYNFIVGDMIILVGVLLAVAVMALVRFLAPSSVQAVSGGFLFVAVLVILYLTLKREIGGKK